MSMIKRWNIVSHSCLVVAWYYYKTVFERLTSTDVFPNFPSIAFRLSRGYLEYNALIISVLSLQELCCRAIVARTTVYSIEQLPLPTCVKSHLKSYALTSTTSQLRYTNNHKKGHSGRKLRFTSQPTTPGSVVDTRSSCVPRNSCTISW